MNRMKELIKQLNEASDAYYNRNKPLMSDKEWDTLFDELKNLEVKSGIVLANSPTQKVGYEVKSELRKVKHNHPMLSLDKTKEVKDLYKFLGDRLGILMLKMDGLTGSLRYVDGKLVSAETRGNGDVGEDILHNAKVVENMPLEIDCKDELIVDGEFIITTDDFESINAKLSGDNKYKNPRNLASGSIRQLDSSIAAKRHLKFIAWKLIKGSSDTNSHIVNLIWLKNLGFDTVPAVGIGNNVESELEKNIEHLKKVSIAEHYPIDGMVLGFDDIAYGKKLGATGHHLRSQIAYKFYDEEVETEMLDIVWQAENKTGAITPVAVFKPVEIDGTTVERASLHNVSIMEDLELSKGDIISVYKANQIIPQVKDNLTRNRNALFIPPKVCPICHGETKVKKDNDTKVLVCTNLNCKGKLLGKLMQFCSRDAMDIRGLSAETLKKFIDKNWLQSVLDLYSLKEYKNEMVNMEGFGVQSVKNILEAIENSKEITLDRFIYSLSIPLIGRSASKAISKHFKGDYDEFAKAVQNKFHWDTLPDFGEEMSKSINKYLYLNIQGKFLMMELAKLMNFKTEENNDSSEKLKDLTFVITGSVKNFKNRNEIKEIIEKNGGKVSGSVSKKTNYLINNDTTSPSGKNKKAKELNISIISETDFISMLK